MELCINKIKDVWRSQTKMFNFLIAFICIPKNIKLICSIILILNNLKAQYQPCEMHAVKAQHAGTCPSVCQNTTESFAVLSLSLVLVLPTFKCGLADVIKRDLYWVKYNNNPLYLMFYFFNLGTYTSCFILRAEFWIIHNNWKLIRI